MFTTEGINFSAKSAKELGTALACPSEKFKITNKKNNFLK
jgi:hypothetical protein